ncbi:hypothetical protein, partial [Enterobacter bugandensis]|uniref:hypothetical protein n=1 Tax=Enterobacter bugandensis TaxID=881260 RepID=UPI0013D63BBD
WVRECIALAMGSGLVPTLVFLSIVLWMAYLFTVNPIYSMVILLAIVLSVAFGSIRTNILLE